MPSPFVYERPVRFDEIDAARIVFFGHYFRYCHEAMESLFGALAGGYVRLINERHVGLPAVHLDADFSSPLRYGDSVRILVDVTRIGKSSATLRYRIHRAKDDVVVATVHHVCVATDLGAKLSSMPWPDDVRACLEAHVADDAV